MGDVRKKFINPLLHIFAGPEKTDLAEWLKIYERTLSGYTDETLSAAAELIIRTRTLRSFPLPAECLYVCDPALKPVDKYPPRAKTPSEMTADEYRTHLERGGT